MKVMTWVNAKWNKVKSSFKEFFFGSEYLASTMFPKAAAMEIVLTVGMHFVPVKLSPSVSACLKSVVIKLIMHLFDQYTSLKGNGQTLKLVVLSSSLLVVTTVCVYAIGFEVPVFVITMLLKLSPFLVNYL